jgi:uncharacterized protein YbjT (DUF2867 family)
MIMRVAVIGASGRIGGRVVDRVAKGGNEVVRVSRAQGVDVRTGVGLVEALDGVEVMIDATNVRSTDETEIVEAFSTATRNVLDAGSKGGVAHHVLLSIVGVDRGQRVPHYAGKRAQEALVQAGPVPYSIVRATQFHDFAAMTAEWTERDGVATVAPLLLQPIGLDDVAASLVDVASGSPLGHVEVAGPRTEDLVDMARRTFAVRGRAVTLVPSWRGVFDTSMAGEVLLPGDGARLAPTSFDDWLAAGAPD